MREIVPTAAGTAIVALIACGPALNQKGGG
jgi:hypothetical protein